MLAIHLSNSGKLQVPFPSSNGSFSVEFWLQVDTLAPASQTIIEHSTTSNSEETDFRLEVLSSGKLRFSMGDGKQLTIQLISGSSLTAEKWHHIAISLDHRRDIPSRPSQVVLYFDGKRDAVSGWHSESDRLLLENIAINFGSCECAFDEIRIWSLFRFEPQISAQMSRKLTDDTPYLVAYYNLDEAEGTTITYNEQNVGQVINGTWEISGAVINVFTTINLPKTREFIMIPLTGFSDSGSSLDFAVISFPEYGQIYEVDQDSKIGQRVVIGKKLPSNVIAYIWDPVYSDVIDSFQFTVTATNTTFTRDSISSSIIYLLSAPSCDEVPARTIDACGVCGGDDTHCLCPSGFNDYRGYPLQDVDRMAVWYAASFTREIFVKMQSILMDALNVLESKEQLDLGDILATIKDSKMECISPLFDNIANIQ